MPNLQLRLVLVSKPWIRLKPESTFGCPALEAYSRRCTDVAPSCLMLCFLLRLISSSHLDFSTALTGSSSVPSLRHGLAVRSRLPQSLQISRLPLRQARLPRPGVRLANSRIQGCALMLFRRLTLFEEGQRLHWQRTCDSPQTPLKPSEPRRNTQSVLDGSLEAQPRSLPKS